MDWKGESVRIQQSNRQDFASLMVESMESKHYGGIRTRDILIQTDPTLMIHFISNHIVSVQKFDCPAKIFSATVGGTGIFSRFFGDTSIDLVYRPR